MVSFLFSIVLNHKNQLAFFAFTVTRHVSGGVFNVSCKHKTPIDISVSLKIIKIDK